MKAKSESVATEVSFAACSNTHAVAIIGRRLVTGFSGGVGLPVVTRTYDLPPGRVVAVGVGPSLVMSDGRSLVWNGRWVEWARLDAEGA
jgi:hypothetical protein